MFVSLGWILCDLFTLAVVANERSSVVAVGSALGCNMLWFWFRLPGPGRLAKCGSPLRIAMLSELCLLYVDTRDDVGAMPHHVLVTTQGVLNDFGSSR